MAARASFSPVLYATTIIGSVPAFAQSPADSNGSNEITLTAQKRAENLQDVPISIQALGQSRLENAQVAGCDDYAKLLPSVSFQSFGPNRAQISFRGVTSGGDGLHIGPLPTAGLYIDETPVTTIAGSVDFHVYDIARVEALSGPQGMRGFFMFHLCPQLPDQAAIVWTEGRNEILIG